MPKNTKDKDNLNEIEDKGKSSLRQGINIFLSRYFKYLSVIIALLALAVSYFYLLKPKYDEIVLENNNIKSAQEAERKELDDYYDKVVDYIAEYKKIKKSDIEKISKLAPKDPDYEKLFTDFEKIIKEQGFILNSLSITPDERRADKKNNEPDAKADSSKIKKIKIEADISGVDYTSLKHLLGVIENNLRLMDIESLNWSPDNAGVQLEIITYYL